MEDSRIRNDGDTKRLWDASRRTGVSGFKSFGRLKRILASLESEKDGFSRRRCFPAPAQMDQIAQSKWR